MQNILREYPGPTYCARKKSIKGKASVPHLIVDNFILEHFRKATCEKAFGQTKMQSLPVKRKKVLLPPCMLEESRRKVTCQYID